MTDIFTERLILRPLTLETCRSIAAGVPDEQNWAPGYPTEGDHVVASIALEAGDRHDASTPWGPFQICMRDEALTAIGGVGALHPPDSAGELEIGYGIAESVRGQGLATEAVTGFIDSIRGFGVNTVVALISPENSASQACAKRSGLTFEHLVRTDQDGQMQRWVLHLDIV